MKMTMSLLGAFGLTALSMFAQAPQGAPPQPMSFFISSIGLGKGADLGGLEGADAQCQKLATAAGSTKTTWHAYLSISAKDGKPAVNARERIGAGPWYNAKGQAIAKSLADLHGDTLTWRARVTTFRSRPRSPRRAKPSRALATPRISMTF